MDKPQKIKDEKEKFPKGVILDQYGNPYGGDNTPSVDDSREEFKPVPTIKAEKKIKKESPEDGSKLKALKTKVRELNEKYLSTTQREDKALLYSQLEQAQREYQEAEEKMDTQPKMSERDRKIARIQALEQVIRDLNEKYLSEMQREQKAILYSQLEQAQKEHRRLEEELDGPETVAKKPTTLNEDLGAEEGKKNPDEPVPPVVPLTPEPVPPVPNPTPTPEPVVVKTPEPVSPIFTPEDAQKLGEFRDQYLKAKRLRGNVFRGGLGGFFRRKLNFGGEDMKFGGKKGAEDLEEIRNEYQEKLSQYRAVELRRLENDLDARFRRGEVTPEACNASMQARIMELLTEEQGNVDTRSVQGIEKNICEKMKTKWRQMGKARLVTGLLLGGAAAVTAGTAVGVGVVGARAVMGGVGTYVGVESGLERYTKLIGHKGLVNQINKEIGKNSIYNLGGTLDAHVARIPDADIRKEAARLRMLQVEKGVSINNLGTLGDSGRIIELIIKRDNELAVQEAMQANESPTLGFADALSQRLATEVNLRNEIVESEVDKERLKKMARKTVAVLAGGTVGWLIGGKLFKTEKLDLHAPTPPGVPPTPPISFDHLVHSGDNTWKIIESDLDAHHFMGGLTEGPRTHMIDAMKDIFAKMNPTQLRSLGFASGDINILHPGDVLHLESVLGNPRIIVEALSKAQSLSPAEIVSIVNNNREISTWFAAHHTELTGVFDDEVIRKILAGII